MYLCLVVVRCLPWLHMFKGNAMYFLWGARDSIVHVMDIALNSADKIFGVFIVSNFNQLTVV